jgi:cell division protein FtsL
MMRLLNICVIAALVAAAAYVYKIKFESTRQAERLANIRTEIRREHDAIAALRAEWSRLDTPGRIQELAKRHLALKAIDPRQFDRLDKLPERPPDLVPPDTYDPIGILIDKPEIAESAPATVPARKGTPKGATANSPTPPKGTSTPKNTTANAQAPKGTTASVPRPPLPLQPNSPR